MFVAIITFVSASFIYINDIRKNQRFDDPQKLAMHIYGEYKKFESESQSASKTIKIIENQIAPNFNHNDKFFLSVDEDNGYSFSAVKDMDNKEIRTLQKVKKEKLSSMKLDSKICYYLKSDDNVYIYRFYRAYEGEEGYVTDNLVLGIKFYDDLQMFKVTYFNQFTYLNLDYKTAEFYDHYQGSFEID